MILAIDLDGTIAEWESVRAEDPAANRNVGQWIEGAMSALSELREAGHEILIHTCRATWPHGGGVPAVAEFLRSGSFVPFVVTYGEQQAPEWRYVYPDGTVKPVVEFGAPLADKRNVGIWFGRGKPIAHLYIDDRGAQFTTWAEILERLLPVPREFDRATEAAAFSLVKVLDASLQVLADPPVSVERNGDGRIEVEFKIDGRPFWLSMGEGSRP